MKFGVPWSVKGIRPEARETAREAARRSGLSLGDWLNTVILQQAAHGGMQGQLFTDDDEEAYGEELAGVHQRLDDLTHRIEQFTRKGPEAYAPRRHQSPQQPPRAEPDQLAELIGRLDRRIEQFASMAQAMPPPMAPPQMSAAHYAPPTLDRAVAEVAARQRALNGEPAFGRQQQQAYPAPPQQPAMPLHQHQQPPQPMPRAPMPAQDISGLEEQLRKITDQIETLRKPGVEEAIHALRGELGDIGRALNDAMPRRAIDTIEKQIQGLTHRIAEGRQAGVDSGALLGIEHGLGEVRDALRGLTPAENLIGFHDAVAGLAQKIDLIVAQKDPATLQQLESAITTLRGMAGHVASNETVSLLAAEVQTLANKVDQIGHGPASDMLNNLEARIDALSRALAERAQNGSIVPPRVEELVQSLSDKIEQIQHSRSDNVAVNHLEDRIVRLVEKLDASEGRLGHLEAIERGLADLLVQIEDMRGSRTAAPAREEPSPEVHALKSDIARTHDVLDAVHGTLGMLVDRMAVIEKNMRTERPAPPPAPPEETVLRQPPGRLAVRLVEEPPLELTESAQAPAPRLPPVTPFTVAPPPESAGLAPPPVQPPVQPAPQPKRLPAASRPPIDPDLPPDQPLEPGSGPPATRNDPSARIAASEAALGHAHPAPAAPAGGPASFIAAARRAAQAAIRQVPEASHAPEPLAEEPEPTDGRSRRAKMLKRMKTLFVAASIVAIVVGSVQIVGTMLGLGSSTTKTAGGHATKETRTSKPKLAAAKPAAAPAPAFNVMTSTDPRSGQSLSALLNPPALSFNPPNTASSDDITGSIPEPAPGKRPVRTVGKAPAPVAHDGADRLPSGIGGQALRSAAASGNAGAAYEVGMRFAEGRGVHADLAEAARWYERAASKGLAPAQFRYASMLEKGQGVKKDLGGARRLYLAAAGQGHAKAMHNLAVLYAEGIDGRPDYATAAKWFKKAAQHGVSDSQYNLGILYARGIGVPKDMGESYKWFALAAAHGDTESAKKRDELATHLDAKTLAAARREVESFKAESQPPAAITVPAPPGGWDKAGPMVIGKR
jgi:localization factor PodJL